MALEVRPAQKLTYRLRLSPQMKLSINLLQLPLIKLKECIQQEVEKNPLLEIIESIPLLPKKQSDGVVTDAGQRQSEFESPWSGEDEEKRQYRESLITKPPTLQEHLLRQLRLLANSDDERKIGELIIGNIDDDGYLRCSIEDMVKLLHQRIGGEVKTTGPGVKKVLALIQTFDPIGAGARDLRECLLIQLKAKGEKDSLAGQIVDKHLSLLEKKRYEHIVRKLSAKGARLPEGQVLPASRRGSASGGKVTTEKVKEAIKEIASLEPKPGRAFSNERTTYLVPDALLRKNKDGYEVILNEWELPRIAISDKYKQMLKQKGVPEDAKEYLKEKLRAARSLIGAVNKRKETIQKILEDVVYAQKDFLDKGAANFKPMTQDEIAKRIGKHKSTVSRAINNKFLQTPYGIFKLRDFLNSGIKQKNGEVISSKNIKLKISELIRQENKSRPITDREITNQLRQNGIFVSRRAITKYRQQLKILPSKSRRK